MLEINLGATSCLSMCSHRLNNNCILKMLNIVKDYPGVRALDKAKLEVLRGEVHALVGENGAGKSTLIKILSGAVQRDAGEVYFDGASVIIATPREAQEMGISVIYQEFNLAPALTVAENIFLGRELKRSRFGFLDKRREIHEAEELLAKVGIQVNPRTPVNQLSVAQRQMVEIAKALSLDAKLIAMDEPSATLTTRELENLFALIRRLQEAGVSVIYISHRLDEIFDIADRVTVFRDGFWIDTRSIDDVKKDDVIKMMVGRKLTEEFPARQMTAGEELLSVKGLSRKGMLHDISFSLRSGEVLALTGLVGSGRTELARAIFGADKPDSGEIYLQGRRIFIKSPFDAIQNGISLLSEDRKRHGLVLGMTVRENITLAGLSNIARFGGIVKRKTENQIADKYIRELRIRTPSREGITKNLSGGNQQKVVLSKWLFSDAKVVIFDEPTRGIDVGAKVEIYNLINELAERGVGILMISSELPEALGMSDRLLIMREGRIRAELKTSEATQTMIMSHAVGG